MTQARLPIVDPLIGSIVEFQVRPSGHFRRGRVSRALPGGAYDVVEICEFHRRHGAKVTVAGRHYPVPAENIRAAS